MNFYPFEDIETISPRPMLFISGDQAHSREFSEDAYQQAAEPKQSRAAMSRTIGGSWRDGSKTTWRLTTSR